MTIDDLKNKKNLILGAGANHEYLGQYLKKHGVNFEVVEGWKSPEELKGRLTAYDVIFRTPGLPFLSAPIQEAIKGGVEIYSQTKLFFDLCPAKIIGVTGTKGKGTSSTLIAKILEANGRKVFLAGNIGLDPFVFLDDLSPSDWVVLELSSFQLQDLQVSPHIAVVLKIYPEHLNHHADFQEYVAAKKNILKYQTSDDFAVLNYDQQETRSFAEVIRGERLWNSTSQRVKPGCYATEGRIVFADSGNEKEIMKTEQVGLLGAFNLENITAAIAAAVAAGADDFPSISRTVVDFHGLEHRLEFTREYKGVKFYNDSFSTTPETAIAALSAFSSPIILIAGGSDKKSDYSSLAQAIAHSKVKTLIAVGVTGPQIAKLAWNQGYGGKIITENVHSMDEIVKRANESAAPGDVVLLSPGAASFDMFKNYKERGTLFKDQVKRLS